MSKICFISNLFPSKRDPSFGIFVGKNYDQLIEQGYQIVSKVVIDYRTSGFKKLLNYIRFIYQGIVAIGKYNYDFIYFHYLTYSTICILPYLLVCKPKYVVNIHGDDLVGATIMHKVMGVGSSLILKHSTAVIVPSEFFKTTFLTLYPWYCEQKIIVSPSGGVNFSTFKSLKERSEDHFTLGYVSRVDEGKGWPELLDAIALIKSKQPELLNNFQLKMYGTGAEVEQLKSTILTLNLCTVVTYFGALDHKQLVTKYTEMNAFIFPTHRESFGLVAVEALACSTPVLASNINPVNEIVIEGVNGLLFEKQNAHSMAEKIIELLKMHKVDYERLVSNARNSVQGYNSNHVAKKLDDDLCKVIKKKV
ncbi:glycosyltransferase family 4 protein [Pseudoalteromonas sp. TB64]|uniref:glycosyltransferase family 4 protein n=1 Tax=Pseudoalteromonas sp. TB64 TaxID=1938600 RepID=UPI000423A5B2|nr:glycosyltransferase family 4 protein [Pseudoalteromonas sp. TB64]